MNQTFTLVSFYITRYLNKQLTEMYVEDFSPSKNSIQTILNYSKSLQVKKSSQIGFLEINSN
jgi:hypothetical protein